MKPTTTLRAFLLGASLLAATYPLHAATISINFDYTGAGSATLPSTTAAGVNDVWLSNGSTGEATNWNNISSTVNAAGTATTSTLNYDDGTLATGASITYFTNFWYVGEGSSNGDQQMYSDYNNVISGYGATNTISLSGLSFSGTYDLIVYLGGTDSISAGNSGEFGATIGSQTYWIRNTRSNPTASTLSSDTYATEALASASGTNSEYIRFTGLTGSSQTITIRNDLNGANANAARAGVRGIQITSIPEVTSSLLCALGLMLGCLRRRR